MPKHNGDHTDLGTNNTKNIKNGDISEVEKSSVYEAHNRTTLLCSVATTVQKNIFKSYYPIRFPEISQQYNKCSCSQTD